MKNIYLQIARMVQPLPDMVLATVVGSKGSTPQKPGSSALFANNTLIAGTVGGGVVEKKVQEYAGVCSRTKESALIRFTLDNDVSRKEDAICGGTISILVDANPLDHLTAFWEMSQNLAMNIQGVLVTVATMHIEDRVFIKRYWWTDTITPDIPESFLKRIGPEVKDILSSSDKSVFKQAELSDPRQKSSSLFFLEPVFPFPRLVIAGAGHIGKALSHLGRMLDFEVIVIDDRHEYANTENLPDADHIIVKDIGEAMTELPKGPDTYLVIVTRGHNDDAKALRPCINSNAGYTGMIGSRSKVAKMHDEFIRNKWATEEQWQKIYTPIGLEIGSKTIEEIAVSIAAQLVLVRSHKDTVNG